MKKISILLSILFLFACTSTPEPTVTPQQKRVMQVKTFDATFENTFQAFKSVLQDDGYVIQNQDFSGGLIVAEGNSLSGQETTSSSSSGTSTATYAGMGLLLTTTVALAAGGGGSSSGNTYVAAGSPSQKREKVGQKYRLSVSFDKINSKTTETRLIIQTISQYSMGSETITEFLGEDTYKLIYDKVNYEIKRRTATGRK